MKNKSILKISILVTVFVLLISGLFGQQRNRRPKLPDSKQITHIVNNLSIKLILNEDQKEKISRLFISHFKKVKKIREENQNSKTNGKKAMDQLRESFETDVKSLLSEEQKKKFDKLRKERRSRQRRGQRPGQR